MTTIDHPLSLAGDFPAAQREQWLALVTKLLGGDPASAPDDERAERAMAKLRSTTAEGIVVQPLYTAVDVADPDAAGLPGTAPFVRGRLAIHERPAAWDVRQRVDAARTDAPAVEELERGAASVLLDLSAVERIDVDVLTTALDGVLLDLAPVVLDAGDRWVEAASALLDLYERRGTQPDVARGSLGADPLGALASTGADPTAQLGDVAAWATQFVASHPGLRTVVVDGMRYHEAGASDAQELGAVVAAGVAYVRVLLDAGLDLRQAFSQIELRLAATADQFGTIAKLRVARSLWARVGEVSGAPDAAGLTPLHAVTSTAMLSRYDPWVNLLRTTVACFAAGIGGADAITVLPYDHLLGTGSELGRRLARNTQSILALESNLAKVADPAGGSWFVERFTEQLADEAWACFQEMEAAGGFRAAVESGLVAERIDATWQARRRTLDMRATPLTGVSEFPNIDEPLPGADPHPPVERAANVLGRHRFPERFEALRSRADAADARPQVFVAALGAAAANTARVTYAKNFFEVAGVRAITGAGSDEGTVDVDAIAAELVASGTTVACICSSDALYAEHGVAVATALKAAGATTVYLAGRPRDILPSLEAAGVDRTIHVGCDVHATLADLLERLEVA